MKRFWTLWILSVMFLAITASGACSKEKPGPAPEPTKVEVPTPAPPPPSDVATCYVPVPHGTPPVCKNAAGEQVTCPVSMAGLPACQ